MLIQIWHLRWKYQKIKALINICLNWVKTYLMLRVKNLGSSTLYMIFIKFSSLEFGNFLLFPVLVLITLLLSTLIDSRGSTSLRFIFNIKISNIVILLNFLIKYW